MRILLWLSAGLIASFGAPAAAQDNPETRKACEGSEPDYPLAAQLAGCTAVITTGTASSAYRANVFNKRGVIRAERKDYDRAIADFSQAIRLTPAIARTYTNRGMAYAERNDYDRAIADYSEAIRLKPDYAQAFANRGVAYAMRKNYNRAVADYSEAIRLQSDDAQAFYNRGVAKEALGLKDEAAADFARAKRIDPTLK